MKYQIWTNGVVFRVKKQGFPFWKWIREFYDNQASGHPKIKSFNSLESAKGYIQGLKDKAEENNPRWRMVEEC